jgi:hypothetical protein
MNLIKDWKDNKQAYILIIRWLLLNIFILSIPTYILLPQLHHSHSDNIITWYFVGVPLYILPLIYLFYSLHALSKKLLKIRAEGQDQIGGQKQDQQASRKKGQFFLRRLMIRGIYVVIILAILISSLVILGLLIGEIEVSITGKIGLSMILGNLMELIYNNFVILALLLSIAWAILDLRRGQ